jgi:signal transduction histidine kinase/DNA-binding response OmpR family regulator
MTIDSVDSRLIQKAGKATAVLQFFAVGLIVVLGFIYFDISNRYTTMQSGVRENAMWSVYQLDREASKLNAELAVMLASGDIGPAAQKRLSTLYDILYGRMDMLGKAKFERYFAVDADVARQIGEIQQAVFGNVGIFDDIAKGKYASRASLKIASASFQHLVKHTGNLVVYTNTTLSSDRADQRDQVSALEMKSLVLIGFLAVIVAALILVLRRQLSNVRAAGLSFERMAANLETAYLAADVGNRAKSQFMATMSHEIRTPLNAILGTAELMELFCSDPEGHRNLRTIRKSGEALLDIINEILDFSKIEHGKLELESRPVDIRSMAESALEMIRGRAIDSGNEVCLDMADVLAAPFIRSDATRLRQVILNLMSNAVKFTRNGKVTLGVLQQVRDNGLSMRVEVTDNGIGIDEEGKAKLFLPFSQVDASITRTYGGTGLGLTICKEIIERLGGTIGVESSAGSGSTFWFEIPIEAADGIVKAPAVEVQDEALPRLKILLVEDNPVNLHVATKFLDHLGQDVSIAEDGAVAVEKAAAEAFDLILMDMQMPVMDGIEAAQLIRQSEGLSRATPIIAMTANASEDDKRRCLEAGMTDFQSKPISLAQLRRILRANGMPAETPLPKPAAPAMSTETDAVDLSAFVARRAELVDVLGEDDFRELLDTFANDATQALSALGKAMAEGRQKDVDALLHTIKGAAGNVGLEPLARMAQSMRQAELDPAALDALDTAIKRYSKAIAA